MKESLGAALVAILMIGLVAIAILMPAEPGGRQDIDLSSSPSGSLLGDTGGPFTALEKNDIRNTIREYLLENPQVIVEALDLLQAQQQGSKSRRSEKNIVAARRDQLINSRGDPSVGNPNASVTLVEFFDYQCPYCRRMAQQLAELNRADPDLRIVYKEFPIFGEASILGARAALAAARQGMYEEFHVALMGIRGAPSERSIMRIADRVGLDRGRLRADMNSPNIERVVQRNHRLAQELGIRGTPSFVIGDELIRGAIAIDRLRELIARQRQGPS